MNRRSLLVFVLIGVAAVIAGALLARMLATPPLQLASGTWLPQARTLADFQLADLDGRAFGRAQLDGHPSLVFFGFTSCPDVCPTTLAMLAEVQKSAPLPHAQVVFVTIDPERDSAANLRVYLNAFSHDFIGLRGDAQAEQPLLHSLQALAARQPLPDGSYTMDHSAMLYVLDTHGRWAAVFSPPFNAAKLSADLRQIAGSGRL
jgi:protein SCO1/2